MTNLFRPLAALLRFQGTGPHAYTTVVRFFDRTPGPGAPTVPPRAD